MRIVGCSGSCGRRESPLRCAGYAQAASSELREAAFAFACPRVRDTSVGFRLAARARAWAIEVVVRVRIDVPVGFSALRRLGVDAHGDPRGVLHVGLVADQSPPAIRYT